MLRLYVKSEHVHYKLCININYTYILYIYKTWVQYKEGLKFGRYIQFVITMYFIIWMWKLHFVGYDLLYYCYD